MVDLETLTGLERAAKYFDSRLDILVPAIAAIVFQAIGLVMQRRDAKAYSDALESKTELALELTTAYIEDLKNNRDKFQDVVVRKVGKEWG